MTLDPAGNLFEPFREQPLFSKFSEGHGGGGLTVCQKLVERGTNYYAKMIAIERWLQETCRD